MVRHPISYVWLAIFSLGLLASVAKADPMPPTVTYTVTGSSDDWALDFTVDNKTNQSLYFFGVLLPATDVTGAPSADWCTSPECDTPWVNSPFGGSSISYNNVWITLSTVGSIGPGNSLAGFRALDTTDVAVPTSIDWFAYTYPLGAEGPYTGGGNFNGTFNPGFEGIATQTSTVPEPTSISLLLAVVICFIVAARSRHSAAGAQGRR